MKTDVSLVVQTVPQKHTHSGTKIKFVTVIWTEMRETGTPKDFKKIVWRMFLK